jgi:GTP 3',8-cyclase
MKNMLLDQMARPLHDLRISVIDRCNLRCRYCMPPEIFGPDHPFLANDALMTFDEIIRLIRLFQSLGVRKIRITGGEPLLRPDLPRLIKMIKELDPTLDVALTTNGILLPQHALSLKRAGLTRINISLDSLDDTTFGFMNGLGVPVQKVLAGIQAAADAGIKIKINMVVQKGINDKDILPMARYFKEQGHILRFIEYMDVGNTNGWRLEHVVSKREIIDQIHRQMPLEKIPPNYKGEVASRYRYVGCGQEIGIISSVTEAFCSTCTRARLSADGRFFTCLFASNGTDLLTGMRNGVTDAELLQTIQSVWEGRDDRYSEERLQQTDFSKKKIEMSYIGG